MREMTMKNVIFNATVIVAVTVGGFFALDAVLSIPDVYFSYSTNECVEVINYSDDNYSCENMPSKFNHVWVK
jgi:hypothetical protein